MHNDDFLILLRAVSAVLFILTLAFGIWMMKHHHRLFGVDASMPSETASSRTYSQLQAYAVWVHVLLASGAFALLMH